MEKLNREEQILASTVPPKMQRLAGRDEKRVFVSRVNNPISSRKERIPDAANQKSSQTALCKYAENPLLHGNG